MAATTARFARFSTAFYEAVPRLTYDVFKVSFIVLSQMARGVVTHAFALQSMQGCKTTSSQLERRKRSANPGILPGD